MPCFQVFLRTLLYKNVCKNLQIWSKSKISCYGRTYHRILVTFSEVVFGTISFKFTQPFWWNWKINFFPSSSCQNLELLERPRLEFLQHVDALQMWTFTFLSFLYLDSYPTIWFRLQIFENLSLIHIWRCRRYSLCRSRWSPYH